MRLFFTGIASLLMLLATQAFADPLLTYPIAQAPECNQGYEEAPEPKMYSQVFAALHQICVHKGGIRLSSQEFYGGNSSEPFDEFMSCIGEKPADYVMFSCTYGSFNH